MTQQSAEVAATPAIAKFRKDYSAPNFTIDEVALTFHLADHHTKVVSQLKVRRVGAHQQPLVLQGEHLQLESLALNDNELGSDQFQLSDTELTIATELEQFSLTVTTIVNPTDNKALEGLYTSAGTYCTQCEAEGFRRITYYLDRPDVLATYTTTIYADASLYPYLLANGNKIDSGETEQGEHWVTWHDPHPKPAYLFALVAGDFDVLRDQFTTRSGRDVALEFFVDKGNLDQTEHAMQSLKNAMRWDEERFGLEYDLDIYMVVAVDFFNMGAMENKGLNVFNSKYVLANPSTATDQDFLNVESVIGHEYFHNWTGNRITCRDWFQLSLKEGLTVFRDQEFSADLGSRAVNRIQDVQIIRTHQFNEDASPMAHPIRPDKVIEMNNFYTVTVYNKGAEVIRMLHTLLGEQGFQRGMQEYVRRYDGQAVTCEDFILAMEAANDRDFKQFRNWYRQAGTPSLQVTQSFVAGSKQLRLRIKQSTPATPGQQTKQPFHMPVVISAYNDQGERLALRSSDQEYAQTDTGGTLLELTQAEQEWVFEGIGSEPTLALLENFSAPVKLQADYSAEQLRLLAGCADDAVVRWDAVQSMLRKLLQDAIAAETPAQLSESVATTLRTVLHDDVDPALRALALACPSVDELAELYEQVPLEAIVQAVDSLKLDIALQLHDDFAAVYETLSDQLGSATYELDGRSIGLRSLRNRCLGYLGLARSAASESTDELLQQHDAQATSMTDHIAALQTAVWTDNPQASVLLADFADQWHDNSLVMDKWLATQAAAPVGNVVGKVTELQQHSAFTLANPNRVYALLATFSRNMRYFHQADGSGYQLVATAIKSLNSSNPQVASRLITPFLQWRRFDTQRQQLMLTCLNELKALPNLASDLYEKISQSLATDEKS